jgi:uncharacterized repeat protein (TIGR02543 family)
MKTTTNIIQPLRNHLQHLALAVTAGVLLGLSVSTNALAASITYVGIDTDTKGDWRTTSVTKPLDISGDNAYGTDGWLRCQKTGTGDNWPDPPGVVSQPSYATLSFIPGSGMPDAPFAAYILVDQPLTPAASVADDRAVPWYAYPIGSGVTRDLGQITMTAAKTFRVALLGDHRADGNTAYPTAKLRIHQTVGGTADSGAQSILPLGNGGKWILFDITGANGDVFNIEATANTGGEADLIIVALDRARFPVVSAASTDWNIASTWSPAAVPTADSEVTVNTHAVTIDSAQSTTPANCYSLTITGSGSVVATGQSLTVEGDLNTTGGMLALDATSILNIANANTSASLANLTYSTGTTLNVTNELTVDSIKDLSGATLNTPRVILAGGTLTKSDGLGIGSGKLIGGNGTVASTVTVASGGRVSPGTDATIATIATNSLSLASGSLLTINAASTSSNSNDQITVGTGGGLTINGGAIVFLNGTGTAAASGFGTYNLISYSGVIGGTGVSSLTMANPHPGREYSFGTSGGFVTLTVTQKPGIIIFDAASSKGVGIASSASWVHTVASGNSRMLVVGVTTERNTDNTPATVFFGSQALTKVPGSFAKSNAMVYISTELWYLVAPNEGTAAITVTFNTSISSGIQCGAVSLFGVKQDAPEAVAVATGTQLNNGTAYSVPITTLTDGAWLVDIVGSANNSNTIRTTGTNMIERWNAADSGQCTQAGATREVATAGPVTDTWGSTISSRKSQSIAAFAPAPTAVAIISGSNGTVTGGGIYLLDATATLTATPDPGYLFTGWTGDASGTVSPLSVLMNANKNITANFTPDTNDTDGDGLTNYQEIVEYGTNPTKQDTDNDGVKDAVDAFPLDIAEWLDTDHDGTGDNADLDDDGDGLSDADEINTYGTNPKLADSDGDGLSDLDELQVYTTNPLVADTDSDGLTDGAEVNTYHTLPKVADTDGDGFFDGYEVLTGHLPLVATDKPALVAEVRTAVEFTFPAASGKTYRIEASLDLATWATVEDGIAGNGAVIQRFYTTRNMPMRYFRVEESGP